LKPADSDDYFNAIRIVRGAGQKPALDTLDGLYEVSVEVDQEPMTPRFSDLAVVQMGNSLDFLAVLTGGQSWRCVVFRVIRRSTKFDHECSGVVSESGTG
jgi:hypothetical protein